MDGVSLLFQGINAEVGSEMEWWAPEWDLGTNSGGVWISDPWPGRGLGRL